MESRNKYYYNEKAETMSRDEMSLTQSLRLVRTVRRLYDNVELYRNKMKALGIEPGDIRGIDDLSRLPFTVKQDFRDSYPYGMFASPMEDIVRLHASSGTTGKQTVVGYTKNDLAVWGEVVARALAGAGTTKSDIVHISYGYGLFTGGMGAHLGTETLGATVIPVSVGNTRRQIQIMRDFGATVLCCTPSYAVYLAETMADMGISKDDICLRIGVFGAEPWTEEMRNEIEARLGIKAHDIYGMSELIGPGVAFECEENNGLHISEDHFIPEVVDPDTGEPLPDGKLGELVVSCVTKEALPLIRYRTRDIVSITHERCACGRTLCRISKPAGRTDDMLIIRGVNVFPSQIEAALLNVPEVAPHYRMTVEREGALDTLEIDVELSSEHSIDSVREIERISRSIRTVIESTIGIAARIRLVEPRSLERSEGKTKHVIDKRQL